MPGTVTWPTKTARALTILAHHLLSYHYDRKILWALTQCKLDVNLLIAAQDSQRYRITRHFVIDQIFQQLIEMKDLLAVDGHD
jgi:hypothetical protein